MVLDKGSEASSQPRGVYSPWASISERGKDAVLSVPCSQAISWLLA